jgi:hypothetical protein
MLLEAVDCLCRNAAHGRVGSSGGGRSVSSKLMPLPPLRSLTCAGSFTCSSNLAKLGHLWHYLADFDCWRCLAFELRGVHRLLRERRL